MGTHELPQCIGTIDYTQVETAEPNEHYSGYRKRIFFPWTLQLCATENILLKTLSENGQEECMISKFYWILQSIRRRSYSSFSVRCLCIPFALIYHDGVFKLWQCSALNIQKKSSSAINGLVHVLQLKIHLLHWTPVLDAYNVLWMLIYGCLYLCLALHNYFSLQKENIPELSLMKQRFWEASITCDKPFII